MKIIGLCGRSGSGKGYVSKFFSRFGALYIDTDAVYHELLSPLNNKPSHLAEKLAAVFGGEIIREDKSVDRRALGNIVFADGGKLETLNRITHAAVLEEVKRIIAQSDAAFALVDAPLLFESGFDSFCDYTLCVVSREKECVKRICERDGISEKDAKRRLSYQIDSKTLSGKCDFTVYNCDGCDIEAQVRSVLEKTEII